MKNFSRENSHFLSKVSRVQICRVLKAVDFLLNDKAESSHLDFKKKILVSPVESSLPFPTLPELKKWLINLQSAFSKFLHEYDVLQALFWDNFKSDENTLNNSCIVVIFYMLIASIIKTGNETQLEKMLQGEGLNGYTLRLTALLYIFESSETMFKVTYMKTKIPTKLEKKSPVNVSDEH